MSKTLSRLLCALLALVMILGLAACGNNAPPSATPSADKQDNTPSAPAPADEPAPEKKILRIAHLAPGFDESQRELYQCLCLAVDEYNAASEDIEIVYDHYAANFDTQTGITQVEAVISKGYDGMIIFPPDSTGLAPSVEDAYKAGIVVVDIADMGRLDIVNLRFLNSEDTYADIRDEMLLGYVDAHPELSPMRTCVLYGLVTQTPQLPRGDRMLALAEQYPDKFEILDSQTASWDATKALNIMEDWITRFGADNIDYVCSSNDGMATGVIQALSAVGRAGEVLVSGVDLTDEALELIKNGKMYCTIGVDWYDYAKDLLAITVEAILDPETYNNYDYNNPNLLCITPDNVEEYLAKKADWKEKTAAYSING